MPAKRATKTVESVVTKPPSKTSRPAPKAKSGADGKLSLKLYREMMLIRRFEERAGQLYGMGLIGGFCHLYIGQEAVADRKSVV